MMSRVKDTDIKKLSVPKQDFIIALNRALGSAELVD